MTFKLIGTLRQTAEHEKANDSFGTKSESFFFRNHERAIIEKKTLQFQPHCQNTAVMGVSDSDSKLKFVLNVLL